MSFNNPGVTMDPSKKNPAEQSLVPSSSKRQCIEDPNKRQTQTPPIRKRNVIIAASGNIGDFEFGRLGCCLTTVCNSNIVVVVSKDCVGYFEQPFPNETLVYVDPMDWYSWKKIGDIPLHIEKAKWANLIVVAPLSANTLAKVSKGLCDDLLTCILRAWDFSKPMCLVPSMTTSMWRACSTIQQINELTLMGVNVILPDQDKINSAEAGHVLMAGIEDIMLTILQVMPKN